MVERSRDDCVEANESMKTKLLSMRMKLRTKVVLAWENPSFDQGRATRPTYTLHVYAKKDRVLRWDLSDQNADTKEIERVAVDAAPSSGTVWGGVGEHDIRLTSTTARLCEFKVTWRVNEVLTSQGQVL